MGVDVPPRRARRGAWIAFALVGALGAASPYQPASRASSAPDLGASTAGEAPSTAHVAAPTEAPPTGDAARAGVPPRQDSTETALLRYHFDDPAAEWRLPGRLREISGLALTADGRLLTHDDEQAIVYEIDPVDGDLVKAWSFGDPAVRGDFEGIAVVGDRVWLVTSDGQLFEGTEGRDDERLLYNTYVTGVGRYCEIEGLAYEPDDETLLLLCKTPRVPELRGVVGVYRWDIARRRLGRPLLRISEHALGSPVGERRFSPSGIERDPATGHYLILAARQRLLAEVTRAGTVIGVERLDAKRHPQAEGITITSGLTLMIGDEGERQHARLTLYAPTRSGDRP